MYTPKEERYEQLTYNRCGRSGLKLPAVSLGLWQNFGGDDDLESSRRMLRRAFDLGVTHFDLANNYGPPYGSAEETFGRVFEQDFKPHRDELVVSTKAGWDMWPGPYGNWGSRKYLVASLDQSLKRMGLEYVDIFYHHRPDPETPLEETLGALDFIVRSGRALYVGISMYPPELTRQVLQILRSSGTRCLIHQPKYSMLERTVEDGLLEMLENEGVGCIVFSPLAQGLLTDRYLDGVPDGSRASRENSSLPRTRITEELVQKLRALDAIAREREQSLAQLAVAWVLREPAVTSALIGASKVSHIEDAVAAAGSTRLSEDELLAIDEVLGDR
jgi:L-glyceraldehyde 3-phosphate reductase